MNLNLTDLANSLKFPIIWDVVSGEKIKFDVALREHEAQGTLFFTKEIYYIGLRRNSFWTITVKRGRKSKNAKPTSPPNVGFLHLFYCKHFLIRENFHTRNFQKFAENPASGLIFGAIFPSIKFSQIKKCLL